MLFLLAMSYLPESPRWLLLYGSSQTKAKESLEWLRAGSDPGAVMQELQSMTATVAPENSGAGGKRLFEKRSLTAMLVLILQVGTGIDVITVYAPDIFTKVLGGTSEKDALLYTIYVGITFIVSTPIAVLSVDLLGRKTLLLAGSLGMTVTLVMLATVAGAQGGLSVAMVLAFVVFFSFSWGPLAWVIPSEMLHSHIRARVVSIGTVLNWVADYAVVSSWLSLSKMLGQSGAFGFYAVVNAAALMFVVCAVPETRGKELDDEPTDASLPLTHA